MECPFCTASLPDDDLFCEACGKPLHMPTASADQHGCTCGATPGEIDEDGYCGRCGKLARRPASDHIEAILSAAFAGVSDRGQKHQRNEDRFAIRQVLNDSVIVVCDGVSSSTQSELASSAIAENVAAALEAALRRHSASSPERTVRTAIEKAQAELAAATVEGTKDTPSTTVVAVMVKETDASVGWVGDSRAYWIGDDGESHQLTLDHSWVNEVVLAGEMTREQAMHAPQAHGITRWLGADSGENAEPDVIHVTFTGSGYLLVCSDGLWNYAEQPDELRGLLRGNDAIEIARGLVEFANEQGGLDNITAVVLRIVIPGNQ
jgi:serine/threonine protein phosphatase PrpC